MVPKTGESENLLVPVCFSASHVAYSSLRMEPQYMIIGHAAGVAAHLAIRDRVPVQKVRVVELQQLLRKEGGVFEYTTTQHTQALGYLRGKYAPAQPLRANWE
jgi:histidinol phosphatase-like PHP family hydrolase